MNGSTILGILLGGGAIYGGIRLLEYGGPGAGLPSAAGGTILILAGLYFIVNTVMSVGD